MKAVVLLFALFAVAHSVEYKVSVKLGSQSFDKIEGASLKLIIGDETYRIKKTDLFPAGTFTAAKLDINYDLDDIKKAQFYWTLPSPYPAKYLWKKPSIYLNSITISDTLETSLTTGRVRSVRFLPSDKDKKISHKEKITLKKVTIQK